MHFRCVLYLCSSSRSSKRDAAVCLRLLVCRFPLPWASTMRFRFLLYLQLIKELKAEMPAWVSKYARGGSARTVSARKLYVVVDAISGHFAANGCVVLLCYGATMGLQAGLLGKGSSALLQPCVWAAGSRHPDRRVVCGAAAARSDAAAPAAWHAGSCSPLRPGTHLLPKPIPRIL